VTQDSRAKFREIAVIALVSSAHFWSHFFVLVIPSSLPLIRTEFGASNVSIAMVIAAYGLMSAIWQFPAGMASDRFGAPWLLIGGLTVMSSAMFLQSMAPAVYVMIAIAAIAGSADSVFHPVDYTIITAKVRTSWLGKAYAIHTFTGFLGFAAAPMTMSFLLADSGWRYAIGVVGAAAFATAVVLFLCRKLFMGVAYPAVRQPGAAGGSGSVLSFLLSPPLLLMFLFYVCATLSGNGIQTFSNSALMEIYKIDLPEANQTLSLYLWGNAAGVLIGGMVSDRMKRFDFVATLGYFVAAALLCLVGLTVLPFYSVVAALFFAGFMIGSIMPARDLAVRAIAPPGGIGKAFGYVSTGFSVGGTIGPLFFGTVMDLHLPQLVFFVSAGMMIVTIVMALAASWVARRQLARNAMMAPEPQPAE
jgi:MFS family permease